MQFCLFLYSYLKKTKTNIHRGEILQAVVKRSDLNISQIVKRTGYSRSSYYNHIAIVDLAFEILESYGKVLHYDFSEEFPEMIRYVSFEEPDVEYKNVDQLKKERDRWRDKYFNLLEKYNTLIEEKLNTERK